MPSLAVPYVYTAAGNNSATSNIGDNGDALSAYIQSPWGVAVASDNKLYIADFNGYRIRCVNPTTNIITTVAGTGVQGSANGAATSATLYRPYGIAVASNGDVFWAEPGNNMIRKLAVATNTVSTVAGTGTSSSTGDGGAPSAATLFSPTSLVFDSLGNIYITEAGGHRIR